MTLIGLDFLKHQEVERANRASETLKAQEIRSREQIASADRSSREQVSDKDRLSREVIASGDRTSKEEVASLDRLSKEGIAEADRRARLAVGTWQNLVKVYGDTLKSVPAIAGIFTSLKNKGGGGFGSGKIPPSALEEAKDELEELARLDGDLADDVSKALNSAGVALGVTAVGGSLLSSLTSGGVGSKVREKIYGPYEYLNPKGV